MIFDILRPALGDTTWPDGYPLRARPRWRAADRPSIPGSAARAEVMTRSGVARDVLRRHEDYRTAFPRTAITYPADALEQPEVAMAVRRGGHAVDVHSTEELTGVMSIGIPARQIVVHDDGTTAAPIRCAVDAGVGRLVLGCGRHAAVSAACGAHCPPVLVDVTTDCASGTIGALAARRGPDLIGLHAQLRPDADRIAYPETVARMIAQMARVRGEHGIILTRVSLVGGEVLSDRTVAAGVLRALAAELEDAFDEACARYRFPRPALILAPR